MKKKRKEFSDTVVVILLIAVILVSFMGTLLVYNNVSNVNLEAPSVNIVEEQGATLDAGSGMVTVYVLPNEGGENATP